MAGKGPPPTPKEILKRRGSWRGSERPEDVKAKLTQPHCPKWLDEIGKYAWERAVSLLTDMGVLGDIDLAELARYCGLTSEWRRASAFLKKHGQSYVTRGPLQKDGTAGQVTGFYAYPQARLLLSLSAELRAIEDRFGMNPSARSRVTASPEDESKKGGGPADYFGTPAVS